MKFSSKQLFFCIAIALTGCDTYHLYENRHINVCTRQEDLHGEIDDGVYYAPDNFFSLKIPTCAYEEYIIDSYEEFPLSATVSFSNKFGHYHAKIELIKLARKVCERLENEPNEKPELLKSLFEDWVTEFISERFSSYQVLYEDTSMRVNGEPAIYVVFHIAGGATYHNKYLGRLGDANRGFLLWFYENSFAICLSEQDTHECIMANIKDLKREIYFSKESILSLIKRDFSSLQIQGKPAFQLEIDCGSSG